ncbi:MAG: response regulator transcription factor [Vicingaceae bacterium]|nr:response regulator transcription factor [Vicingaceae bacterium]
MERIKLMIVDDHKVVRTGLKMLFKNDKNVKVVAEAKDGEDALKEIKRTKPDVVITDISMPNMNGIQFTAKVKETHPEVKVLVLSMHDDDDYILDALDAGAMGYLTKDTSEEEIIKAIHSVANEQMYYSSSISSILAKKLLVKSKVLDTTERLTERELEVLDLIVNGFSNKEIASKLFVSKRTIDNHRTNIMKKIDAKNTADIVRIAYQNNLVKL